MNDISRLRNGGCAARPVQVATAWMLVFGFLLQPVLGYLVTPFIAQDAQGHQVVVCTLNGQKLVTIDLSPVADKEDIEHCPALKLYQMAGSVQVSEPPVVPQVLLYAVQTTDQTAEHQHRTLHFSAYSTRAPPGLS